ncbi:ankyrin repeat-containing domain protein [Xylaria cubensis]|nr:ankyrin repeat-containing domain protein [Xylaria cubensis]
MGQRFSRIKDKISLRKGGRGTVAQLQLAKQSSTVSEKVQPPKTPPNAKPCLLAQAADSEIPPMPTPPSQAVSKSLPLIQAQSERLDEQETPPKPYTTNLELWNEASGDPDVSKKYGDIKKLVGEPDRDSSNAKGLAVVIKEKLNEISKAREHNNRTGCAIEHAVEVLSKFTSAVDVAVSFDPAHAALPWAAVRFVLIAVISSSELRSQVLAGIAAVASLLTQCDTYQQLYMAPNPDLRPPEAALHELKTTIVKTFVESQLFLSFAYQQQQSKIRSVAAPFRLSDAGHHLSELSKCEKDLAQVSANCEKHCSLSSRSNLKGFVELSATFYKNIQNQLGSVIDQFEETNRMRTLKWISPVDYGSHHIEVEDNRTLGTCEWLINHERFYEWEDSNSSMILWLQGDPGAGKTFLTSKVIDHVQGSVESSPNQEGFAYFYCNRNEEKRRKPLCILRSCVRQLSTTLKNPGCIRKQLQNFCYETELKGSHFGFSDCKKQLLESVNIYSQTTIILDALDECEPDSRIRIFETVEYLLSESKSPLKIFISSRPDQDIRTRFLHRPNVKIQATDNEGDIQKFINAKIIKHGNWGGISPGLRDEIVEVLFARSKGMFQWASLQTQEILLLRAPTAIRDRLGKLPPDLKTAYDEIYNKIQNGHKHERSLADNAFKWVACAREPPNSAMLLSAIRLNSDTDNFELLNKIDESQLLHLCKNLLVFDSQRDIWRFSHLSVTEYFEQNHWSLAKAHCHAASVCLKFLSRVYKNPEIDKYYPDCSGPNKSYFTDADSDSIGDIYDNIDKSDWEILDWHHPVQKYALMYWISHTKTQEEQEPNSTLRCLLKSFLGSPLKSSTQYRRWVRVTDREVGIRLEKEHFPTDELLPEAVALFAMCRFGFYTLLKDWWDDTEFDITLTNSKRCTLLGLAVKGECKQIYENLMKRRIVVNLPIPNDGSALAIATRRNNIEIMKLLIEAGADVNMPLQHGRYGSALAVAASQGEIKSVELLVDKGADLNMQIQDDSYGSALAAAAAYWERINVISLLIDKGANLNMQIQNGSYGSALAAAISHNVTNTTEFLVSKGADVNMRLQCGQYGSALAAAAYWGRFKVARLLIDNGADLNMQLQHGSYGSAFAAAAIKGQIEVARLLIDNGVDVNMQLQCGEYGSALAAAASEEQIEVARLLINNGANVNMQLQHGNYGSALAAAASEGEIEVTKLLINNGADINMRLQYGQYGSALAAAIRCRKIEVARLLIDNGVDVNMQLQHGSYGNALAAAVREGEIEVARLLIDNGADVNMQLQCGEYGSALAVASSLSYHTFLEFLVDVGADVNMQVQVGDCGNALLAAIVHGNTRGVEFLVMDAKADVNQQVQHGKYGNALAAAAFWGRKECVDILIQAGAEVNLRVENGSFRSALEASRGILPVKVIRPDWKEGDTWDKWDERRERKKRRYIEKGRVIAAKLLRRHGAIDEA